MKGTSLDSGPRWYSYSMAFSLVLGIYGCFLSFGYVLEKLLKFKLHDLQTYSYPLFIVSVTSGANLLMSVILIFLHDYYPRNGKKRNEKTLLSILTPKMAFRLSISSLFCVLAQITSTYALPQVGIPTQVIIKSSKMVPILIGGYVLFKKRYPWYDYFAVLTITFSLILFNFGRVASFEGGKNTTLGVLLCFASLMCDGLVGPIQDDVLSKNDLHPYVLMFITNAISLPFAAVTSFVFEGYMPIYHLKLNVYVAKLLSLLALTGSFGQLFVLLSIKSYGSLYTGVITTLRKAISTMLSVYLFNHRLTLYQWIAMAITFSTILMQQVFRNLYKKKKVHVK
ncbi:UAA transporter family member protein [Theileria equi strain WA]|uniref:UAA transporter family member protein n=1 Tax=Theileria equi strain WA TaxID=1537102 RepID=L1LGC4_THEEQ|nr:UAA transporter family member protein [Theileria equi strain WA]EKX74290.1 UAA transporter family member protein [Theileria equi strain WA]|eukprot:XP_004833742.1 UAA transporter family member protein [Theileria equi strain WA]